MMMKHVVEDCPVTKFTGGLRDLHRIDVDAVAWLDTLSKR